MTIEILDLINVADTAKKFELSKNRIRELCACGALTRKPGNGRFYLILKDDRYKDLFQYYQLRHKLIKLKKRNKT